MPEKAVSHVRLFILLLVLALVAGNAISLYINLYRVKSQYIELASEVGRTFVQAIEAMRDWNTLHQGVYVPTSADVRPNEYLVDPLRDITSTGGIQLTKINHAQMARMISELF